MISPYKWDTVLCEVRSEAEETVLCNWNWFLCGTNEAEEKVQHFERRVWSTVKIDYLPLSDAVVHLLLRHGEILYCVLKYSIFSRKYAEINI